MIQQTARKMTEALCIASLSLCAATFGAVSANLMMRSASVPLFEQIDDTANDPRIVRLPGGAGIDKACALGLLGKRPAAVRPVANVTVDNEAIIKIVENQNRLSAAFNALVIQFKALKGQAGSAGVAGAPGREGPEGPQGPPGKPGSDGRPGADGKSPSIAEIVAAVLPQIPKGPAGERGPAGPQGPAGPAGPAGLIDPATITPIVDSRIKSIPFWFKVNDKTGRFKTAPPAEVYLGDQLNLDLIPSSTAGLPGSAIPTVTKPTTGGDTL